MKKLLLLINLLLHPIKLLELLAYKFSSDKLYLKIWYYNRMGYWMDFNNPKTFNEKLQWLKLYNRKPEYTTMVDKYAVKKFVADIIGDEYIIPTLGVWDSFEDIDFDKLPNQFVLKCTHDSGGLVICKDKSKFNKVAAKEKIEASLKTDFYKLGREWPYKNVPRRIIAEKYMEDSNDPDLKDYKLMCFNGIVQSTFVCSDRATGKGLHVTFMDRNWEKLPFERHYPSSSDPITKPVCYEEMVVLAEKLSAGIPFVRVDFYEINKKVYFGELTFFPGCGTEEFTPTEWDFKLGQMINIDNLK